MASTKFITFFLFLLVTFNIIYWDNYIETDEIVEEQDRQFGVKTKVTIEPAANFCKNKLFIVTVHVRANDFSTRQIWRGMYTRFKEKHNFEMMFAIGQPGSTNDQCLIAKEAKKYGDILQGNFLDTYHNITYKHLTHIYYIHRHCNAPYVVKLDDDVAFKPDAFANLVQNGGKIFSLTNKFLLNGNKIWCRVWEDSPVQHNGKWNISSSEISEKTYPNYCSGFAYFTTRKAISALAKTARDVNFFWVDDIFVTGYLARKASTQRVNVAYLLHYAYVDDYEHFKDENIIFSLTKKKNLASWNNKLYKNR